MQCNSDKPAHSGLDAALLAEMLGADMHWDDCDCEFYDGCRCDERTMSYLIMPTTSYYDQQPPQTEECRSNDVDSIIKPTRV